MGQIKIDASNLADSLLLGFVSPRITSIVYPTGTATDPAGGETITIKGTGFQYGATARIAGVAVGVTTVVDFNTITFTAPAKTAGNYALTVLNADGGLGTSASDLVYSGAPTWSTAAGSLGSAYETASLSTSLSANSDSAVTFSLSSGTLPGGTTLASNGLLSGTLSNVNNATTYNFTIAATDAESQSNTRSFSYVTNPDVVSFSTSNNITISTMATAAMTTNTMVATSAAGKTITYSVNSLPTGISINATSGAITGTPTVEGNTITLVTATANTTNKTANITVNFNITPFVAPNFTASYLVIAGAGGGGLSHGGGGGAGGVLNGSNSEFTGATTYTVVVGAGGAGAASSGRGTNGSNSSITATGFSLLAIGGGAGGGGAVSATWDGNAGGSGGGGGGAQPPPYNTSTGSGGAATSGQGNGGGGGARMESRDGGSSTGGGGGGYGTGGVGSDSPAGMGGNGIQSNITGTLTSYAGGGGGSGHYKAHYYVFGSIQSYRGGTYYSGSDNFGAGDGSTSYYGLSSGTANRGGGGGGRLDTSGAAGSGGSGIVVLSYPGSQRFTGGTVTTVGSNTVHTFTSSGSLVPV